MKLPPEAVSSFAELYKKKFGIEMPVGEAQIKATELLKLYALAKGRKNII